MPKMKTPRELFLHELGDILYAERVILKALPTLQKESGDKELTQGLKRHERETKQQVRNLERAFKTLKEPVKAEHCPAIDGIKAEHDDFVKQEKPTPEILTAFLTGAGSRTEHYEIAAYTGLVTMARAMGERDVAKLLGANLKQEKQMLREVEAIAKRLAQESAPPVAPAKAKPAARKKPARKAPARRKPAARKAAAKKR